MDIEQAEVGDCEAVDGWSLAQDVNAWSSLGYVVAGLVFVVAAARQRVPRSFLALAVAAIVEGVGSVLYHGDPGDVAQFVHDAALVAVLGFISGWHVGRLTGRADAGALVGFAAGAVAGAVGASASAAVTNSFVGAAVVVLVGAEIVARRRRLPAVWNAAIVVLVGIGVLSWVFGTSDSPLCDADSWAQPHALWHLLSALVLLAWVDLAAAAAMPDRPPRLWRRTADRGIGLLATMLTHAFHRSVDVVGRDRIPSDRPMLVVANHGNGFVDPIVVASVLRRLPRFIAKAALWKVPVLRPFLGVAGVLPVYRSGDGDRAGDNRPVFAECHRELAGGATVAIFPEGTTGDRAGLDRVRAGAARIALGAVDNAPDLAVVPIGLAFESRVETRSRAVVMIGIPIDAAGFATQPVDIHGEPGRFDVETLTSEIRVALEQVSPEFASVEEREILRAASRTATNARRRRGEARFGEVETLARQLAGAPPEDRQRIVDEYRRYATQLQLTGLTDQELGPAATSLWRLALAIIAIVVLGSLVVTATLIHLPALLLVVVATAAVHSTATKGTVRMLVGLVAGLLTWVIAGIVIGDGVGAFVAAVAVAAGGALALAVWAPLTRTVAIVWGRLRARDRGGLMTPVLDSRAAVVDAVGEALESAEVTEWVDR
jgi:1-acyl-sn-glycerol-3-phosphate acyltransferase